MIARRDRRLGASPSLALDPPSLPPALVPACGGATRAYRAESCIPRATRGGCNLPPPTLWHVYAAPKNKFCELLILYNRSVLDRDHDRS